MTAPHQSAIVPTPAGGIAPPAVPSQLQDALNAAVQAAITPILEHAGLNEPEGGYPTIAAAIEQWKLSLGPKAPKTAETYGTGIRRLVRFLQQQGIDVQTATTATITENVLEMFYLYLMAEHGRDKRSTANVYRFSATSLASFLTRRRLIPASFRFDRLKITLADVAGRASYKPPRIDPLAPARVIMYAEAIQQPPRDRSAWTLVQDYVQVRRGREVTISAFMRGAKRTWPSENVELLRDRAILRTLFSTGVRRRELCDMNKDHVNDLEATITGKGDKDRWVFWDQATLQAIRAYLDARGSDRIPALFIRFDRARYAQPVARWRLDPQSINLIVKRYARAAGESETLHPHAFRHAKASLMLEAGAPLALIQQVLGHANINTTALVYAHASQRRIRQQAEEYNVAPEAAAGVWGGPSM